MWLGEAKFYRDGKKAISEAIASVNSHLTHGFLQQEKALVGPLISPSTPGYKKLQWIFDDGTSLDEIVDRMIIPVLITYDSKAVSNYKNKYIYLSEILSEMAILKVEAAKAGQMSVELRFIYMPIGGKYVSKRFYDTPWCIHMTRIADIREQISALPKDVEQAFTIINRVSKLILQGGGNDNDVVDLVIRLRGQEFLYQAFSEVLGEMISGLCRQVGLIPYISNDVKSFDYGFAREIYRNPVDPSFILHAEQAKVFNRLVRGEGLSHLLRPVLAKVV